MTEQEAQQAQTIAGIKLWFSLGRSTMKSSVEVEARKKVSELLEIVDSQAQKIAEQAKEIEQARTIADEWREKAGSKYDPFPWETTDSKVEDV
jgi:DNA gyrase/topoisomerase IV subunit B